MYICKPRWSIPHYRTTLADGINCLARPCRYPARPFSISIGLVLAARISLAGGRVFVIETTTLVMTTMHLVVKNRVVVVSSQNYCYRRRPQAVQTPLLFGSSSNKKSPGSQLLRHAYNRMSCCFTFACSASFAIGQKSLPERPNSQIIHLQQGQLEHTNYSTVAAEREERTAGCSMFVMLG